MSQKLRMAEIKIKDLTFNNEMFKTSNDMGRPELDKRSGHRVLERTIGMGAKKWQCGLYQHRFTATSSCIEEGRSGLREKVHGFDQEKQKMLAWFQKKRAEMSDTQSAFEAKMARVSAEKEDAKQALNAVAAALQDLERFQSHFANTTPRALLMMKSSSRRGGTAAPIESCSCRRFRETDALNTFPALLSTYP